MTDRYRITEEWDAETLRTIAKEQGNDALEKCIRADFEPLIEKMMLDLTGDWPSTVRIAAND